MTRPVPGFPPVTPSDELDALDNAIEILEDTELVTAQRHRDNERSAHARKTVAGLTHLRDRLTPD